VSEVQDQQFTPITEEALDRLRAMIGTEVRRGRPYITELSADAVRHYAYGIGDTNPLWVDEEYATNSVHGGLMAPPSSLYATDRILSGYVTGLPGVHAMFAGTEFRFHRAPRVGDHIRASARLKELIERPSRFAGRSIQQIYEVDLTDQDGALVAQAESYCFRTGRDAAREIGKYEASAGAQLRWKADEIEDIAARYRAQAGARRGATPRHVEDVRVGDPIGEVIKGPYTATTAIAYLLGWGGLYVRAHGDAFDLYESHPALGILNEWGVPEPPERVHWDPLLAQRVGVPGAYDYGPERVSWLSHAVTDWMGDAGFLQQFRVEVRRHNLLRELVTVSGAVTEVLPAERTVKLELLAVNQDGDESARGTAEVVLPSRGSEVAP
jgi:acyl dehydratase